MTVFAQTGTEIMVKEEKKEEEKATTRAVSDRISEEPVQFKKRRSLY